VTKTSVLEKKVFLVLFSCYKSLWESGRKLIKIFYY